MKRTVGRLYVRCFLLPGNRPLPPFGMIRLLHKRNGLLQKFVNVSDDRFVNHDVFIDLTVVDIHLKDAGTVAPGFGILRHAVAEAGTQCNNQICVLNRPIGGDGTVHSHHAQAEVLLGIHYACCHQRIDHRNVGFSRQFLNQFTGTGLHHAAAHIHHRLLCGIDHLHRRPDVVLPNLRIRTKRKRSLVLVLIGGRRHILCDVHQNRSRPPAPGDDKCLPQRVRQVFDSIHEKIMFRNRHSYTGNVDFLECVLTD